MNMVASETANVQNKKPRPEGEAQAAANS